MINSQPTNNKKEKKRYMNIVIFDIESKLAVSILTNSHNYFPMLPPSGSLLKNYNSYDPLP